MRKLISSVVSFSLVLILSLLLPAQTWGKLGIVYSPFVRESDRPGQQTYTREDVKDMLKLVKDKGYQEITTYGVGAPDISTFKPNHTWKEADSIVHTATAAAEINKENNNHTFSVYLGIYLGQQMQPKVEVDVGLEMAKLANQICPKTVKALVYPSLTTLSALIKIDNKSSVLTVASQAKSANLEFGTRIADCENLRNSDVYRMSLLAMDFIICQIIPNKFDVEISGPEKFMMQVDKRMKTAKEAILNILRPTSKPFRVILETGWPGKDGLPEPNTNVSSMLKFWGIVQKHLESEIVFMHEAFDNPWKKELSNLEYPQYYGRWKIGEKSNGYELKVPTTPNSSTSISSDLVFGIVFGLALFIILAILIFVLYRRVKLKMSQRSKLTDEEIRQFLNGIVTNKIVDKNDTTNPWTKMPYNQDFELPKDKFSIDFESLLGTGAFGAVYKGRIAGLASQEVAFKTVRNDCPASAFKGLLSEIKILIYLAKHENIVSICGAYTSEIANGIVYVATEFCPAGSLEKILRTKVSSYKTLNEFRYVTDPSRYHPGQITDFQLLQWSMQIASGMEYISSKNVIHADLATRNVLLSQNMTAKITDFGLSRKLYEYTEYVKKQQEPLPWRWMAIESLKRLEFSSKSDVWSYGVTIWEIFSLGDIPYPGLMWDVNFVHQLETGLRVQQPTRASDQIYRIMTSCWNIDPDNRPSFSELKNTFLTLITQSQQTINAPI